MEVVPRLEWRVPCTVLIVKRHKLFKDAEEKEALCQSVVRDGSLRQMFTDQVMLLHRKALVSRLAEKVYCMIINDKQKEISKKIQKKQQIVSLQCFKWTLCRPLKTSAAGGPVP